MCGGASRDGTSTEGCGVRWGAGVVRRADERCGVEGWVEERAGGERG
jgi:hypothetical protein